MTEPLFPPPPEPGGIVSAPEMRGLRARIKPVHRATAGSVFTGVIGQLTLLVSGVLAARLLGPEDRGHLALLVLIPFALSFLGSLGLPLATTYFIARTPATTRPIIRTVMPGVAVQIIALVPVHASVAFLLYDHAAGRIQWAAAVSLGVVPASIMLQYGLAILQGRRQFKAVNLCRILQPLLCAIVILALFTAGVADLFVVTLAWTACSLFAGGVAMSTALRRLPAADGFSDTPPIGTMIRFGTRAFLGSASPVEMFSIDQAVVGLFVSPAALGLYVVATAFTNLPRFLAQSIGLVAYPTIAAMPDRMSMRASMWRFFWVTLGLSAVTVLALEVLVGTLVPLFYGDEFVDAVPLARILLLAAVFFSCRRLLADAARGCGHPTLSSVAEAASWLSLFPLLAVLVPLLGVNGVALAVVLSSTTSALFLGVALVVVTKSPGDQPRIRLRPTLRAVRNWSVTVGPFLVVAFAGAVVPFLSPLATVIFPATIAAAGLALLARRRFRRPLTSLSVQPDDVERLADPAHDRRHPYRLARGLYYLGLLFMGQLILRPGAGFTLSDFFFLAAFLATCSELALSGRPALPPIRPRSLVLGTALFSAGVLISSAPLASPGTSLLYGLRFAYLTLGWFWIGSVVLRSSRHIAHAMSLWSLSIALSGLAAVAQLFLGDVVPGTSPTYGRMTGTAAHVNDLGGMAAIALPAALVLLGRSVEALWSRRVALVLVLLISAGAVLSGSVGGLLAGTVGVGIYFSAARVRGRSLVVALVVVAGGILLVNAQGEAGSPNPLERATRATTTDEGGTATLWLRLDTNHAALEAIADSPVVGAGLGQKAPTGYQVHNILLGPWFEAGLLAMLGMLTILVGVGRAGLHALRAARSRAEWQLTVGLLAAFSGFLIFGMGAPVLFQRYGWVTAALLISLRAQQLRASSPSPPSTEGAKLDYLTETHRA